MVGRPKIAKREGGDGRRTRESPLFAAFFAIPSNRLTRPGLDGWGGRDRTSEWRNQNQLGIPWPPLTAEAQGYCGPLAAAITFGRTLLRRGSVPKSAR